PTRPGRPGSTCSTGTAVACRPACSRTRSRHEAGAPGPAGHRPPTGLAVRLAAAELPGRRFPADGRRDAGAPRRAGGRGAFGHRGGAARARSDAGRPAVRGHLRSQAALHDVFDLLDRRRHPQPGQCAAGVRAGLPGRRGGTAGPGASRSPAGGAGVRRHRRSGRRAAAAHRAPGADRGAAPGVGRDRIPVRVDGGRGAVDAAAGHRRREAARAAARDRRPARRGRGAGAVHPDRAAPPGGDLMSPLFWNVAPYVTLAVLAVGVWWRYRYDKFGWTTRPSRLYASRLLRIGTRLFHLGTPMVIAADIIGLVIPKSWTSAIGFSQHGYYIQALVLGGVAGVCPLTRIVLLVYRRRTTGPVFLAS